MKVSIVVPVHNEVATLEQVLDEIEKVRLHKEVIVVDDASTDQSGAIIESHPGVHVAARLHVNQGKGMAIRVGMEHARGEVIVIQDADLELSPSIIEGLVAPLARGDADAVFGSRFIDGRGDVALSRWLANRFLTGLVNRLYGLRLTDMETAHKAFRTVMVPSLDLGSSRYEIEVELTAKLARLGARIVEIPSPYSPRTKDEGKGIGWVDGVRAVTAILRYRLWSPVDAPRANPSR